MWRMLVHALAFQQKSVDFIWRVEKMEDTVTELKKILGRERTAKRICSELNNFVDLKPTLITVIKEIKKLTGCAAVGVRLHDDGDYPYYVFHGFQETFIKQESSLCARDEEGNRIPTPDGKSYLLECMCGNVIRGRYDSSLSFFTEKGSFWSNNTTELLATTIEVERQGHTRNTCNSSGYESVALIPIKARDENIGLIQLNDRKRDMFTEDLIEYMEMIGENVGLAIQNSLTYTKLKEAVEEIHLLRKFLPICSYCKKIRDDEGYWHRVETYIQEHSDAEFSHGICPECSKELFPNVFDDEKKV